MAEQNLFGAGRDESPLFEPPNHPEQEVTSFPGSYTAPQHTPMMTAHLPVPLDTSAKIPSQHKRKADELSDGAEDDEVSDYESTTQKHDPESEPFPQLPIFHPAVKKVERYASTIVRSIKDHLYNSSYRDEDIQYLAEEAERLEDSPYKEKVLRIGFHGTAGSGKSSALNSLLGYANLASVSEDGKSCTSVPVEYFRKSPTQKKSFEATVDFYSRQACLDMVKEQLQNMIRASSITEDMEEEEASERRADHTNALAILTDLFMDRYEFVDSDSADEFLTSFAFVDDPKLISLYTAWTARILNQLMPHGDNSDVATLDADTASEINHLIKSFIMPREFNPEPFFEGSNLRCCPWPFVRKVRVCLDSRITNQGIMLIDLPGVGDKIRSRMQATKRVIQSCDVSIIVCAISRAIDNATFNMLIYEAFRRRGPGKAIAVITHSDVLNIKKGQGFMSTAEEEEIMAQLSEETEALTLEYRENEKALRSTKNRREIRWMKDKKDRLISAKEAVARKVFEVRVKARNRFVKTHVKQQYVQDTRDRTPLEIFCVSNTVFEDYLHGQGPAPLTLDATEIVQLRANIFAKPSEGKWASLEHWCRFSLPTWLNTVEMSCTTSKIKRKEELKKTFVKSREALQSTVQDLADRFQQDDFEVVYTAIVNNEHNWCNQARAECKKWAKFKPGGYTAVIRHYGTWSTKTVLDQHWNEDLLLHVSSVLDSIFEHILRNAVENLATDIAQAVGETLDILNQVPKIDPAANLSRAVEAFRGNLENRKAEIDKACMKFKGVIKDDIREIHLRATTEDDGHYFTTAMRKVYEAALTPIRIRGKKVHDCRSEALLRGITARGEHGVFLKIAQATRVDFEYMFSERVETLIKRLDSIFAKTQYDVEQMCSTKEDDSKEAKNFRAGLLAMLPAARAVLENEVHMHLETCKIPRTYQT